MMDEVLCPCSRADSQKWGQGIFYFFVYISSSHFLIMNCVICSVFFFHWWFWVSLYCFCSQFFANSCTFAFHSLSMHIVTSHCTFLSVNQLCLIKPFPFHVYDQTSWRLEVKCRWYIYCMHLSETCQKIDLFWYSTILYWPWCMFAICKWQLSELTAWNSNVASSLFPILALVLFFFYCLGLVILDLLSVWPLFEVCL